MPCSRIALFQEFYCDAFRNEVPQSPRQFSRRPWLESAAVRSACSCDLRGWAPGKACGGAKRYVTWQRCRGWHGEVVEYIGWLGELVGGKIEEKNKKDVTVLD